MRKHILYFLLCSRCGLELSKTNLVELLDIDSLQNSNSSRIVYKNLYGPMVRMDMINCTWYWYFAKLWEFTENCLQKYLWSNGEDGHDQLYQLSSEEGDSIYEDVFQQRKGFVSFMFKQSRENKQWFQVCKLGM